MCLDRVTQTFDPPMSPPSNWIAKLFGLNRGYKVVRLGVEKWQPLFRDGKYPYNEWLISNNITLNNTILMEIMYGDQRQEYNSGFHFFNTKKDAAKYADSMNIGNNIVVLPILYKNVVAYGTQNDIRCIVAKEIFVECPT